MLKQFLLRWLVNFLGLWTAATLLSGINYGEHVPVLVWAALIFSIVNALIRPLIILLTLPMIVLTLGLFTLVINAFMLYLVTFFYHKFHVTNFRTAIVAVIIVWVVNYLLDDVIEKKDPGMKLFFESLTVGSAVLMIITILLQARGTGLSASFGGEGNTYRSKRGAEKVIYNATIVLAVVFVFSVILGLLSRS